MFSNCSIHLPLCRCLEWQMNPSSRSAPPYSSHPTSCNSASQLKAALLLVISLSVACRICQAFGREEIPKVKKTSHPSLDDAIFTPPLRPENFSNHLVSYYEKKWEEYCALDDCFKLRFFDKKPPYAEKIESHFGHWYIRVYIVASAFINTILQKILVNIDGGVTSYALTELLTLENCSYRHNVFNGELFEVFVLNMGIGAEFPTGGRRCKGGESITPGDDGRYE